MNFGFFELLNVLGSLAFFIYGMKLMSEGIQRAAGSQLRQILKAMTKNKYLGVFTGFLITAIVQSSSATTVMTVSFVNAGLLTLVESAGVMMGANIGTTVTGWIISILGLKVSLSAASIPLFAIGLPLSLSGSGKLKYWGQFVIGFAILFLGLTFLKDSVPDLDGESTMLASLQSFSDYGFISRVAFVLIGALVTIIVQSSSAAMAVTLTLCYNGWLPLDVAAAMVLGENIGTTITAEVASLVGNTNAKRSARIHSLFNVVGVCWMIILMPYILPPLATFVENSTHLFEGHVKLEEELNYKNQLTTYTLAAFHTFFNLTNVLLLLPFTGYLVKIAISSVKQVDDEDEHQLKYIGGAIRTPELATIEVLKETSHFGEVASRMSGFAQKLINSTESKVQKKMIKKLTKYEKITDRMEIDITEYITNLANQEITQETSITFRSILNICNDLERIGDIYFQISKIIESKIEDKTYFTPIQRQNINEMIAMVDEAFAVMINNLESNYSAVTLDKANQLETKINSFRDQLRVDSLDHIGDEDYNVNSAIVYNNIFSLLEKVGDHIINVSESVVGEI